MKSLILAVLCFCMSFSVAFAGPGKGVQTRLQPVPTPVVEEKPLPKKECRKVVREQFQGGVSVMLSPLSVSGGCCCAGVSIPGVAVALPPTTTTIVSCEE